MREFQVARDPVRLRFGIGCPTILARYPAESANSSLVQILDDDRFQAASKPDQAGRINRTAHGGTIESCCTFVFERLTELIGLLKAPLAEIDVGLGTVKPIGCGSLGMASQKHSCSLYRHSCQLRWIRD